MSTPTPRTDAAEQKYSDSLMNPDPDPFLKAKNLKKFSDEFRTLERELSEAREKCDALAMLLLSKDAGKVIEWEQCEQERDQLRKVCEFLKDIPCTCYLADDGALSQDAFGNTYSKTQTKIVCTRCQLLTAYNELKGKEK